MPKGKIQDESTMAMIQRLAIVDEEAALAMVRTLADIVEVDYMAWRLWVGSEAR